MSALDRFREAAQRRDLPAAARELADDVVLYNPMSADPLRGRDAVTAALKGLDQAFDDFEHVAVFAPLPPGANIPDGGETQAIRFRASIGEQVLDGFDILQTDSRDRITSFTVLARPLAALQALGQALSAAPADAGSQPRPDR